VKNQRLLYSFALLLALIALGLNLYSWLVEGDRQDWFGLSMSSFFTLFCLYGLASNRSRAIG
jgi:hypothetical protein